MSNILPPPRVLAVHDLSCVGRCALTVVIPTLSVMGCQVVPLPTALLSSHTGGFNDLWFRDLTPDMEPSAAHFSRLGLSFRAIYTGFLGSAEQIRTVSGLFDRFSDTPDESGERPLLLVDPVMGDDGVLYSTYTPALADGIREISRRADLITPNLTEACFLTGVPYRDTGRMSREDLSSYAGELMEKLTATGPRRVVITGLTSADGTVSNFCRDTDGRTFFLSRPQEAQAYPGTGDVFASVLLGTLIRGETFDAACAAAADFIGVLIRASAKIPTETRFGAALEPELWRLAKAPEKR